MNAGALRALAVSTLAKAVALKSIVDNDYVVVKVALASQGLTILDMGAGSGAGFLQVQIDEASETGRAVRHYSELMPPLSNWFDQRKTGYAL